MAQRLMLTADSRHSLKGFGGEIIINGYICWTEWLQENVVHSMAVQVVVHWLLLQLSAQFLSAKGQLSVSCS